MTVASYDLFMLVNKNNFQYFKFPVIRAQVFLLMYKKKIYGMQSFICTLHIIIQCVPPLLVQQYYCTVSGQIKLLQSEANKHSCTASDVFLLFSDSHSVSVLVETGLTGVKNLSTPRSVSQPQIHHLPKNLPLNSLHIHELHHCQPKFFYNNHLLWLRMVSTTF